MHPFPRSFFSPTVLSILCVSFLPPSTLAIRNTALLIPCSVHVFFQALNSALLFPSSLMLSIFSIFSPLSILLIFQALLSVSLLFVHIFSTLVVCIPSISQFACIWEDLIMRSSEHIHLTQYIIMYLCLQTYSSAYLQLLNSSLASITPSVSFPHLSRIPHFVCLKPRPSNLAFHPLSPTHSLPHTPRFIYHLYRGLDLYHEPCKLIFT